MSDKIVSDFQFPEFLNLNIACGVFTGVNKGFIQNCSFVDVQAKHLRISDTDILLFILLQIWKANLVSVILIFYFFILLRIWKANHNHITET